MWRDCYMQSSLESRCPLYAQSMYYFSQAASQAILLLELALFPGQQAETPTEIGLPSPNQSLSILQRPDFDPFVQFIHPAWEALLEFGDYLDRNYVRQDHLHVFQAIEDVTLMVENVATIRGVRLLNDAPWTQIAMDALPCLVRLLPLQLLALWPLLQQFMPCLIRLKRILTLSLSCQIPAARLSLWKPIPQPVEFLDEWKT
eukprot:s2606_g13.t1